MPQRFGIVDREHGVRGDRSVGRAAAVAQHAEPCFGREVIDRRHHRGGRESSCEGDERLCHRTAR